MPLELAREFMGSQGRPPGRRQVGRGTTDALGIGKHVPGQPIGGHLEVVKWLRANGCPWDAYTCTFAAEGGHLEVLKWARANGCEWHKVTCSSAAAGGHLDVLKWARDNGCPWDENTCSLSAWRGHLDVLMWARGQRLPLE